MTVSSTIVLKRTKKMPYVSLDFKKGVIKEALMDSRAYVSAIAENEPEKTKQQAPPSSSKLTIIKIFKNK